MLPAEMTADTQDLESRQSLYKILDPDIDLSSTDLDNLYVNLDKARGETQKSVRDELYHKILNSGDSAFTYSGIAGHRGCGKTTELRMLEEKFKRHSQYHPVFVNIEQLINIGDVDFIDVALAIVGTLGKELENEGIPLKSSLMDKLFQQLKGLLASDAEMINVEWTLGILKMTADIKASDVNRKNVREALNRQTVSLIDAVNDVIELAQNELERSKGKQLVILVDGLDKMIMRTVDDTEISMASYLFDKHAEQLKSFKCHVVYMMPIELLHAPEGPTIDTAFGGVPLLPMVKVAEFSKTEQGECCAAGVEALRQLLEKRCGAVGMEIVGQVFDKEGTVADLICKSGGQPRVIELITRSAMNDGGLPITMKSLESEYNKIRRTYDRTLTMNHIEVIHSIQNNNGRKPRDPRLQTPLMELLANRGILKYHNGIEWYAPNPLLPADAWPIE